MRDRVARGFVALYPPAWRKRYGDELLALVEESPSLGVGGMLDLLRGAAREWRHHTRVGADLGLALEAWMAAVTWSLLVASIGSLITGAGRFAMGLDPVFRLPFLTAELVRSFVLEIPAAVGIAAACAAPWFALSRMIGLAARAPLLTRLLSLAPSIAVSALFVLSAEQLAGVVAAGWVVSSTVGRRPIASSSSGA